MDIDVLMCLCIIRCTVKIIMCYHHFYVQEVEVPITFSHSPTPPPYHDHLLHNFYHDS